MISQQSLFFHILLGIILYGQQCEGRVLLFPHGERMPGELGALMAGAQRALASGTEAAWYNPAGMAKERRNVLSVGGFGPEIQNTSTDDLQKSSLHPFSSFLAFSTSPSSAFSRNRLSYGFFLFWPINNRFSTPLSDEGTVNAQGVPSLLQGAANLDLLFPAGIHSSETASGFGELRVLASGMALGYQAARGFRLGFSLRWERLRFEERGDSFIVFSATSQDTELKANQQTTVHLVGEAGRLIYTIGTQMDLGSMVSMGLTYRLPSRNHVGSGSFVLTQSGSLQVQVGTTVNQDNRYFTHIAEQDLDFTLKQSGQLSMGIAFSLESMVLEIEWIRSQTLGEYPVFPTVYSSASSSSQASKVDALRTSSQARGNYALGMAWALGEFSSLLFGYAGDAATVLADDPLFRPFHLETVSGGYYFSHGKFSATVGLSYRSAEQSELAFSQPGNPAVIREDISFNSTALLVGFSYIL